MKKRSYLVLFYLITSLAVAGCKNAGRYQPAEETVKGQNTESSSGKQEAENAALYYGKWKIVSGKSGQYSAMSEEDIEAMAGKVFEYYADYAVCDTKKYEAPVYQEKEIRGAEFSELYQGMDFETLGISDDKITNVIIENVSDMGSEFYQKDENTLIMVWDGVLFELERAAD